MGTDEQNCPPLAGTSVPAGGTPSCDCSSAMERLHLFLDQEIDSASCEEIQQHLDECRPCMSEVDMERLVKKIVGRSCSEQAPQTLFARIQTTIRTVHFKS